MEIAQASPHPCCGLKNVGHWWSAQSKIRRLRSCPKMYTIFSMRAISKTSYKTWSEKTKPERGVFTEAKTSPEKTSRTVPRIAVFAGLLADPDPPLTQQSPLHRFRRKLCTTQLVRLASSCVHFPKMFQEFLTTSMDAHKQSFSRRCGFMLPTAFTDKPL